MIIKYWDNGSLKEVSLSNDNILITEEKNEHHFLVKVKALKDIILNEAVNEIDYKICKKDTFFTNGYQSWTTSYEGPISKKEKKCYKLFNLFKFLAVRPYGDYEWYQTKNDRLHSYDFFYVKGNNEIFIINNNYQKAFLIIETLKKENKIVLHSDLDGKLLKAGEEFVVFDYEIYPSFKKGMEVFNNKYPKKNLPKIFGYTSWYNYYQDINEEIILRDLRALDNRFDLFQIDDGYETFVGDWLDVDPKKFPNGLKPIVDETHQKGLKAGLWLAPFLAEDKSKLVKEHPEWIKKDKNGNFVRAGVNWSGPYCLDLSIAVVREYIKKCFAHYVEMGFDFFKLDFLYASAYTHKDVTRAEASFESYEFLKECLKDKIILGCGATLGSVYNNFDYLRIGPDVTLDIDDKFYMKLLHRERPSTRNTAQNTIYRSFMNDRLFGNDPDVYLLRDEKIKLKPEQKYALVTINALFGNVLMTSDDIGTYDDEKKMLLQRSLNIYRKARNVSFVTLPNRIHISYEMDGAKHEFDYLPQEGVIENER